MRLQVQNKTGYDDAEITAICKWVASFFPQRKGRVLAIVSRMKRELISFVGKRDIYQYPKHPHHGCWYWTYTKCFINFAMGVYPVTVTERLYFKHASGKPDPYTLHDWRDSLVHVLAHELCHGTKANRRMRRSRQELHAENKATEVLKAWQDYGRHACYRDLAVRLNLKEKGIETNEDDNKVSALRGRLAKWESKAKRAKTAIMKLNRQLKYYERKAVAQRGS